MTIEQHGPLPTSNYMPGRNPSYPVDSVVLHTMDGWISAADARFKDPASIVSAPYGVRLDGAVWQWLSEADTAYHAGDWIANLSSIGIEHEDGGDYNGVRPDALYAASAALVRDICTRHGIPIVRGTGGPGIYDHRYFTATACPDALDTDRIIREAQGGNHVTDTDQEFMEKYNRLVQPGVTSTDKAIKDVETKLVTALRSLKAAIDAVLGTL